MNLTKEQKIAIIYRMAFEHADFKAELEKGWNYIFRMLEKKNFDLMELSEQDFNSIFSWAWAEYRDLKYLP